MEIEVIPELFTDIRKFGRFDGSLCFNCGSCTVTCNLVNNKYSFPRRIIQYSLLGLKEKLISSLEPWLCYDCRDCSITCPQKAEPGESMATVRRYLAAQYDWTGISSRIFKSKSWEIGILSVVGAFFVFLAILFHVYIRKALSFSEFISKDSILMLGEPSGFEHMFMFTKTYIYFTLAVFFIPLFFLLSNAFRMYLYTIYKERVKAPFILYIKELKTFLLHTFTQRQFRQCTNKTRWIKHFLLFSGCLIMIILPMFFLRWFQTDKIYPIYHPQRWLGYLATLVIIYFSMDILISRLRKKEEIHKYSEVSDITFPVLLLFTALSGLAIHIFRYLGFTIAAHFAYFIHIAIVVPMLIIEIPFSKWSHGLYHPLAIYLQSVKEKTLKSQLFEEVKKAA